MSKATDQQVQVYMDTHVRPHMELCRAFLAAIKDDKLTIGDIYDACLPQNNPTWTDQRTDGPPHLLVPTDLLAYNSFITALINNIENASDFAACILACVRPVGG